MKINRNLNLVIYTEGEDGQPVYVHATPLSRDIFRENFVILGRLYGEFFSSGIGMLASARTASLLLEKIAREMGQWDGAEGVKNNLLSHIINGATAIYAEDGKGWVSLPLEEAVARGILDVQEVLDEVVFFTCVCAMTSRLQMTDIVKGISQVWGALPTSLSSMDYTNSLKTSPKDEATEPKAESPATDAAQSGKTESSIPS